MATRLRNILRPDDFAEAVLTGLAQPQKVIPARYFYDAVGSALFEEITRLPDYYPTRTEIALLDRYGADIAARVGRGRAVVEFGSGSSAKTPPFLKVMGASAYVPIDISAEFLDMAAADLAAKLPGLPVLPLAADFTQPLTLPPAMARAAKLGFFPGSTLGNCTPAVAVKLLQSFAKTLGEGAWLVIGLDRRKPRRLVEAAYNDPEGVTARFNLNVLARVNAELGGTIAPDDFVHRAPWNPRSGRIEMHLEAVRDTSFSVLGRSFAMRAGETIHTENSYKWTPREARLLARASGWAPVEAWSDDDRRFSLHLWQFGARQLDP